jgi:RNA polymerase sigma-70 factor (ECF subfamily)
VVLERLTPAERVAFVLHDVFAVSFDDIAPIIGRSLPAVRQLADRVQGSSRGSRASLSEQRETVEAFLSALRAGDVEGLLTVLDSDVVRRADAAASPSGIPAKLNGATAVLNEALTHTDLARFARPVLVNGSVGILVAPGGRLRLVIRCSVKNRRIIKMQVIADPARLRKLNLAVPSKEST